MALRPEMTCRKTAAIVFGVSLLIELAQLTGLFFIYNGSYRLFDIDDLLLNTLGGISGFKGTCMFMAHWNRFRQSNASCIIDNRITM